MCWYCTISLEENVRFDPQIRNMLNIPVNTTVLSYYYLIDSFSRKEEDRKKNTEESWPTFLN